MSINIMKKNYDKYRKNGMISFSVQINQKFHEGSNIWKKDPIMYNGWQKIGLTQNAFNNNYNGLAIKTGKESGVFVIDIDNNEHWNNFLNEEERTEPKTTKVKSGSGGIHLYFKYTDDLKDIKSRSKAINNKWDIDVRTNGGCIYAPPTKYFNKNFNKNVSYDLVYDFDKMIELPLWLKKIFIESQKKPLIEKAMKNIKPTDLLNVDTNKILNEYGLNLNSESITEILLLLKKERFENYSDWLNIMFSLKNSFGNTYYNEFDNICKKYKGYDKNGNLKIWNGLNSNEQKQITIRSLLFWARADNQTQYNKIILKYNVFKDDYYYEIKKEQPEENKLIIDKKYLIDLNGNCEVSKFVNDYLNSNIKVLKIKSPYNTGKTTLLTKICDGFENILFVSYRITLSNNLKKSFGKLGFKTYIENPKCDNNKLICQIDSLFKIPENKKFDLIIIDESESIINHFNAGSFKNKYEVFQLFIRFCNDSLKIISLDGDLHSRTHLFCDSWGKCKYIVNTIKKDIRTYHIHQNEDRFINLIFEDLKKGLKICVVSMNEKKAQELYSLFSLKYTSLIYTGMTDDEEKKQLKNVDNIWISYQLIIYTPCIESGVDFNVPHINKQYLILSSGSTSQRGVNQMGHRVRQLKDSNIHTLLLNLPLNDKSYDHYNMWELLNHYNEINETDNFNITYYGGNIVNKNDFSKNFELYDILYLFNQQEYYNKKANLFFPLWKQMNINKGHKIIIYEENKKYNKNSENIKLKKICMAEQITENDYNELKQKQATHNLNENDKLQITRYIYEQIFGITLGDPEILKQYYNKMNMVKNAKLLSDKIDFENKNTKMINKEKKKKLNAVKQLCILCNINTKNIIDDSFQIQNKELKNKLKDFNNILSENNIVFGLNKIVNIESTQKLIPTLKKIFENYGIIIRQERLGKENIGHSVFSMDNNVKNKINKKIDLDIDDIFM